MKPAVDGVNALDLKHADAHRVYVVAGGNHVMVELDHETAGNLSMPPSRHATATDALKPNAYGLRILSPRLMPWCDLRCLT